MVREFVAKAVLLPLASQLGITHRMFAVLCNGLASYSPYSGLVTLTLTYTHIYTPTLTV